jgi:general secretion pathway protein D
MWRVTTKKLLWTFILAFGFSLGALADTVVSIQPVTKTVAPGEAFSLGIFISGASDVYAYQFDLGFDPAVLSALDINEDSFLSSAGTTLFLPGVIDNVFGTITFTGDTLTGPIPGASGAGTLAVVDFKAGAAGASSVNLLSVQLLDSSLGSINSTLQSGSVAITVSSVPEPATFWLLLPPALLIGIGGIRLSAAPRQKGSMGRL